MNDAEKAALQNEIDYLRFELSCVQDEVIELKEEIARLKGE